MGLETAALIALAAGQVGGTAYQIVQAKNAQSDSEELIRKQQEDTNRMLQLDAEKKAQAERDTARAQTSAIFRQNAKSQKPTMNGTLLTNPLGIPNTTPAAAGGKTLLGL